MSSCVERVQYTLVGTHGRFWCSGYFCGAGERSPNRPTTVTLRSGADVADAEGLFDRGDFLDLAQCRMLDVAMARVTTCWYPQIWIWKQPQESRSITLEHEPPIKSPKVDLDG